jgi:pimeloyl-ACP methyl ester carboxylesterase
MSRRCRDGRPVERRGFDRPVGNGDTANMAMIGANGIELCYETFGNPSDPAMLLLNGFTSQLTGWDTTMCERFAARGRYVIRYDNRDVGLSSHLTGGEGLLDKVMAARKSETPMPTLPYLLSDMASDGMGLLTALGIERAHIAGVSMGGMIVQTMAIEHPHRVLSLTSIMSTTGEQECGQSTPEARAALTAPPVDVRSEYIEQTVRGRRVWSSPRYFDDQLERARIGRDFDRMFFPDGATRQYLAILGSPPRADGLRSLTIPTLVIHGRADTLISPSGGERTAELVPGATLMMLDDMGHDLPIPLWPTLIDAIVSHQNHSH